MRRLLILLVMALGASFGPAWGCGMALILATDVSSSIDEGEFRFQVDGLADALLDPEIADVLVHQQVALSVVQWSGENEGDLTLPWRRMLGYDEVRAFSARVRAMPRVWNSSNTAVGDAIAFSAAQFAAVEDCARRVIDVSGDGASNAGGNVIAQRNLAEETGIEINGIAIDQFSISIPEYYRRFVVTKNGFVVHSRGFNDYPRSIREKLLLELIKPLS